ncbi:uncharacterized protein [Miscanthus floridulus]|uniref:uncharacterized protein n=1 Tax=Miscanthus floridulus TaxID=154761 RepID=UPI003459A630
MAKLSGAAVLLLVVVPLSMYTCALLVGIQLVRALERGPGNSGAGVEFTWRGALDYVTKELWDINVLGRRRGERRVSGGVRQLVPVVVASWSTDVERSSSSLREEALEPYVALPDLPSADHVLKTNSSANDTSRTQQRRYYNHTSPRGVISVGPWGGSGGQPFYMRGASTPRLRSIILYHSGAIHSLSCEYTLAGDYEGPPPRVAGPWGLPDSYGSRGVRTEIDLPSGEHITAVEGTTGHFANVPGVVITSLTFRTSAGRTYGPYGSVAAGSHYFSVPAADGACIVGFWGRSGWLLDAIGVYMKPSCSSSDTAAYKNYASRRQGRN